MVEQPQRKSRYSDKELSLINNTFADNLSLIFALRKALIQQTLSESEEAMIKNTFRGDVADLLYKLFIPKLDGNAPMTNLADIHFVPTDDRSVDIIYFDIMVNKLKYDYLEQQLTLISGGDVESRTLLDDFVFMTDSKEEVAINFAARVKILNHVESMLQAIMAIAGEKKETPDEILKRLGMDSSK